jgi:SAM-dependent methyltransferase
MRDYQHTVTITTHCPRGSYIRWGQDIQALINKRYSVIESSSVDETISTDEINRTIFSFEVDWRFARDFIDILCQVNPYSNETVMRDYQHIERYLNTLADDIYPQPPDSGHQAMIDDICAKWLPALASLKSILDVGCGQGQAFPVLQRYAGRVEGVTLGSDFDICRAKGLEVRLADMSFLPYPDDEFDLIFARHVLEHSPAPLLSLMEWWRVSKQWLMLVLPHPKHYGYIGKNHYYVLIREQVDNLLSQAGWRPIWENDEEKTEIRIFCEKVRR